MKRILIALLLILFIFITSMTFVNGQESMTTLSIDDYQVTENYEMSIPIMILNATNLLGGELNLTYNSSVIQILNVRNGDIGLVTPNINNTLGLTYINTFGTVEQSGDIVFAWLDIIVIGNENDFTTLDLTIISLFDINYNDVSFNVKNGTLSIVKSEVSKTINLIDYSSGGDDAKIVSRTWKIYYENGTLIDTFYNSQNITYSFPTWEIYNVTLTIENECGNVDTYSDVIDTGCPEPTAYFIWKRI